MRAPIWVWFVSATAFAQLPLTDLPDVDAPCAPQVASNRHAAVVNSGEPGVWFHRTVADCMLGRLQLLPAYASRIRLLEERLTISDDRHALQLRQVSLAEHTAQIAEDALEAAVRRASNAEAERDAWYRAPLFWFIVGTLTAVVAGIVTAVLVAVLKTP
jgi:hypothetical protein